MSEELSALLAESARRVAAMSPAERQEMMQRQRESWVRAMAPCEHGVADFEECAKCRGEA